MRGAIGKMGTFIGFAARQRRRAAEIRRELSPLAPSALQLTGGEPGWVASGHVAKAGEFFRVSVSGHLWLSKPLMLAFNAGELVWLRIGGQGPARKVTKLDAVYEAWADGPVEVFAKGLSAFKDASGAVEDAPRKALPGGVGVTVSSAPGPATTPSSSSRGTRIANPWRR